MSQYNKLLHHSILELDDLGRLIKSAQNECECVSDDRVKCIPCLDREKIIFHHMQLVRKICKELSEKSRLDVDEFMADGIIGLNNAINEFDPDESKSFFHFASNAIRWTIIAGDISGPLIKIPSGARRKIRKIHNRINQCEQKGETISYQQLCEEFNIDKSRLLDFLTVLQSRQVRYIIEEDGSDKDPVDQVLTRHYYDSEEWIDELDLENALETLSDYQKKIITNIFGIGTDEKTLRQLSKEFEQSYEKTRQDYHKALDCLKQYFNSDKEEINER